MAHIGILCPPGSGHLNPMGALGRELQRRGHRVTAFNILDSEPLVRAQELDFCPVGQVSDPLGSQAAALARLGQLTGLAAARFTLEGAVKMTTMLLQSAPTALREAGVQALLVDQVEPAGTTIAQHLDLPFATVCNALPVNREVGVPPFYTPWAYRTTERALLRNRLGYALAAPLLRPMFGLVAGYRRRWGLPPVRSDDDLFSSLAQLSQLPCEFDFPRRALPNCFHYTGPLRTADEAQDIPFPYDRLTDQPLIYASMGTLQNRRRDIFRSIAAACIGLDAQLVLSLGGGARVEDVGDLPGSPLVVAYAPQLNLLSRARLTITHAGLNTVLESLSHGVPMVALPITNDQPGVGARVVWTGAGTVLSLSHLNTARLRTAIRTVLDHDSHRVHAMRLREAILRSGGARRSADIVEHIIATGQPMLNGMDVVPRPRKRRGNIYWSIP